MLSSRTTKHCVLVIPQVPVRRRRGKAAAMMLLTGKTVEEVSLMTPKGILLHLLIEDIHMEDARVSCAVRKDGGDDPDATNGALVYAEVTRSEDAGIHISGGPGVGRVTRPGLQQPVGEAAINRVPRSMITKEAAAVCRGAGIPGRTEYCDISSERGGDCGSDIQSEAGDRRRHLHTRNERYRHTHE